MAKEIKLIAVDVTDSTNHYLRDYRGEEGTLFTVVTAEYQTSGRGQGANRWESEWGKNLLFSLKYHPRQIESGRQFVLSMAVSLAIVGALERWQVEASVKWPNDIYVGDCKLCGILIENALMGNAIRESIVGIGLNVNQTRFLSDAPNPISLKETVGEEVDGKALLDAILQQLSVELAQAECSAESIHSRYLAKLYRRQGVCPFEDKDGRFDAELVTVAPDGRLWLKDSDGRLRSYGFKEVSYLRLTHGGEAGRKKV